MSRIGIYISGLGQSFNKESLQKYAERFKNEMLFNESNCSFEIKSEIINYSPTKTAKVIKILKVVPNNDDKVVHTFYEFEYNQLLTERFNNQNILLKNLILFWLVIKKLPQLIKRIFIQDHYNRPYLTFYAFFILVLVSLAVLFLIPASIDMVNGFKGAKEVKDFLEHYLISIPEILIMIYKWTVPLTTIILLTVPESKTIITSIATEFACADRYINDGIQSQVILGNLDLLIEFIAENELEPKIEFHCYSFGSIIAMDILFPLGNISSNNVKLLSNTLITIGNPYEFINSYYANYFSNRNLVMGQKITWLNIYSLSDALSSNFRNDSQKGEALFGLENSDFTPLNLNYEITPNKSQNFFNFITMDGIRMHRLYWDTDPNGQSCMRIIVSKMNELGLTNNE